MTTTPSAEELALLSRVVREVARARHLAARDTQDFIQTVQLRLIERDYDVFRQFTGRSSLRTYLRVVVTRMLLDWRNSEFGKWRASAAATRLGEQATRLERLIHRDGYSTDEAIELLRGSDQNVSVPQLRQLAAQLPQRQRRTMVSDEALRDVSGGTFEDPIEDAEAANAQQRIRRALKMALQQLSPEERWLIRVRYGQNRSVQTLARSMNTDPKTLYRRFDRTLRSLRRFLVAAGVSGPATLDAGRQLMGSLVLTGHGRVASRSSR